MEDTLCLIVAEVYFLVFFLMADKTIYSVMLVPPCFSAHWVFYFKVYLPLNATLQNDLQSSWMTWGLGMLHTRRIQIWFATLQFRNSAPNSTGLQTSFFLFCNLQRKGLTYLTIFISPLTCQVLLGCVCGFV